MNLQRLMARARAHSVYMDEAGGEENPGGGAAPNLTELQAQIASLTGERDSMKSKMDQLLTETKAAKTSRREAEEAARIASDAKALKDNDFEQLFKSSEQKAKSYQEEAKSYQEKLSGFKTSMAKKEVQSTSQTLAQKIAEGDNINLLSTFIQPRLKHTDDGIKVLDHQGNLTVSSLDDLVNEFKTNSVFASLLKGNKADGGGAPGGNRSSGAGDKIMTRVEFDQISAIKKSEFIKSGGKTID
jgi:alanyl-tRNA synthetase